MKHQAVLEGRFGSDQSWRSYLDDHSKWVRSHERDLGITAAERTKPALATAAWAKPGWWPNPGKMISQARDKARGSFLSFLNDWFYARLSGDSHLSYMGLARRAAILSEQHDRATRETYRDSVALSALSLYVALLSEVVASAALSDQSKQVRSIWQHIKVYSEADDLWTRRYDALLV
jgi:hypothetical protein